MDTAHGEEHGARGGRRGRMIEEDPEDEPPVSMINISNAEEDESSGDETINDADCLINDPAYVLGKEEVAKVAPGAEMREIRDLGTFIFGF